MLDLGQWCGRDKIRWLKKDKRAYLHRKQLKIMNVISTALMITMKMQPTELIQPAVFTENSIFE
jgi:hypothetical protein